MNNWVVVAVGKYIATENSSTGRCKCIGIDESTDGGVVITGLQVIEPGIMVINIATIQQRIQLNDCMGTGSRGGNDVAPGVIGVVADKAAGIAADFNHIALQIGDVIVGCAVQRYRGGIAVTIVGEVEGVGTLRHLHQLGAVVHIGIGIRAVAPAGAHTVGIIGVGPGGVTPCHGSKLSAMLPSIGPCTIVEGITHLIVGNGYAVIRRQQVAPSCIAISVHNGIQECAQRSGGIVVLLAAENIARIVISPDPGFVSPGVVLPNQLTGRVINIGAGLAKETG